MRFFIHLFCLASLLSPLFAFADSVSLFGRVMCGYQGWFATPSDGSDLDWVHYGFGKTGHCHIDLWPDVSELDADERYDTPLKFADGRTAQVFSSAHPKTVRRHFEWMRDHGIDGVFLQRFGTVLKDPRYRAHHDRVLQEVRASAKAAGRSWCVMYDLSGLKTGELESVIMQDWKRLRSELRVLDDLSYQHHAGKPVVAVWGVGFNDGRDYTLAESHALLRFLHDNPEFGKLTVMAGVPWHWRTLAGDAVRDTQLHEVLKSADILSPWAVGRYGSPTNAAQMISKVHEADVKWCRDHGLGYLPVVFPGFSWRNLSKMRGVDAPLNAIPRLGGEFLWSQARARISNGSDMLYIAMFDEMDEGTAIFKTTAEVPDGAEGFVTEPLLKPDHYLWLSGMIGRALRREIELTPQMPRRD